MTLQKARITDDRGASVEFQFNPETISFTKTANWSEDTSQSSPDSTIRQFKGTKPLELSLKLILDESVAGAPRVADRVNQLLSWTNPVPSSDPPKPHDLRFEWGTLKIGLNQHFKCHCQSVGVEYSLFRPDGTPIRATATVKLVGLPTTTPGTNPTSGAEHPLRSHVLMRGDDLAVLAHHHYGRTRYWRRIAEVNGIDNPFRLPIGREILLPDRLELEGRR